MNIFFQNPNTMGKTLFKNVQTFQPLCTQRCGLHWFCKVSLSHWTSRLSPSELHLPNTKPEGTEQRDRLFQTQDSRVVSNFALQTTLPGPPGLKLLRTFCQGSPQLRRPCPPMGRPRSWVDTSGRQPRTEGTRSVFLLHDQWP